MEILLLCFTALIATVLAWVSLNVQESKASASEQTHSRDSADVWRPVTPSLFAKPSGRRLVFLIVMFVSLCGLSTALECIYRGNTFVDNLKLILLLSILFVASYVDARQRIIPNILIRAGLVIRVIIWIVELFTIPDKFWTIMKDDLSACLLVVAFVVVGVFMVKGGIGMGDIKLMLVMCLFQGFYGVVSSLFFSLFVAFFYAVGMLLIRKKSKQDSVAFAPAILLGTGISIFLTGM